MHGKRPGYYKKKIIRSFILLTKLCICKNINYDLLQFLIEYLIKSTVIMLTIFFLISFVVGISVVCTLVIVKVLLFDHFNIDTCICKNKIYLHL